MPSTPLEKGAAGSPSDWSSDGRFIPYTRQNSQSDIWALSWDDRKSIQIDLSGASPILCKSIPLFTTHVPGTSRNDYAPHYVVSRDEQRFLVDTLKGDDPYHGHLELEAPTLK